MPCTMLWLNTGFRLSDNPALAVAIARGNPVAPVFIWPFEGEGNWPMGSASRVWMEGTLACLRESLRTRGSELIIRHRPCLAALDDLAAELGADALYFNWRYEPAARCAGEQACTYFKQRGFEVRGFNASLLAEPSELLNKQGKPYQVFTPYWRAFMQRMHVPPPIPAPECIPPPPVWPDSEPLEALSLRPKIPWDASIREAWTPGEAAAQRQLDAWCAGAMEKYAQTRDFPGDDGVSRLSPYLHFGEISPKQIWHAIMERTAGMPPHAHASAEAFLRQLAWREFAHYVLYHFPDTPAEPLRPEFAHFPWRDDREALDAWRAGHTGFPLIDAGMRELWATGWMHNRVRMITASFFTKDLLLPWQSGARWFWDTLVDADLANNSFGWQWAAGCGADAAPYFRIFNPVAQGERYDRQGVYVRRWIPELAALPDAWLHKPWKAPASELARAGVALGKTYPFPIVDHEAARARALDAFASIRGRLYC